MWPLFASRNDYGRPLLPRGIALLPDSVVSSLPRDDEYNREEYTQLLSRDRLFIGLSCLAIVIVTGLDFDPLSLDGVVWRPFGVPFDDIYRVFFLLCLFLIVNSMFTAWSTWDNCRALLLHLDRTPLRWSFRRIRGFSWKPLWGLAGADLMGAYKPLSRALEALAHLRAILRVDQQTGASHYLNTRADLVQRDVKNLRESFAPCAKASGIKDLRGKHDNFAYRMQVLQNNLAAMCSLVWVAVLQKAWQDDTRLVTSDAQKTAEASGSDGPALTNSYGFAAPDTSKQGLARKPDQSVHLAEEFITLVYINFIHRVLLRIRWLVLAASCVFVLLLFSAKSYPFEPKNSIDGLFILVFLGITGSASVIYAQMHRDAILSHLTNTKPGELGSDFWIRIVGFSAVPIFSLMATQVPSLNRAFYLWLKPVLDAVHR